MRNNGSQPIDTREKALRINLDDKRYGTFAEIGAGQEVVRWLFRVGGAAGTIAKSISAYDMTVSDAIYGQSERYVSRSRLEAMLEHEYRLNLERLSPTRGSNTAFFAFADTVAAQSYRGNRECHGWMGIRFQSHPRDSVSEIVIHVRMRDRENAAQQEALGIVGINLIYAAFFLFSDPEKVVESLLDGLGTERIEIDMIEFSGIEFRHVDNRLMSMKLVELGLSGAAMFAPDGRVLQPSEALYKKHVLVQRGSFRPVCHAHLDILRSASERRTRDLENEAAAQGDVVELMELTMRQLLEGRSEVDRTDFLARADMLAAAGKTVLVSDYFEFYRLAAYLRQHTDRPLAFVMGAATLGEIFDEAAYEKLPGGILESLGRLFSSELKLYVYPLLDRLSGELTTVASFPVSERLRKLYAYLVEQNAIRALDNYDPQYLPVFSRDVLRRIAASDASWETMVPGEVAHLIKQRNLLGHRAKLEHARPVLHAPQPAP
jgi:hypothetical protein